MLLNIFCFFLLLVYVVNTAGEEQHKDMYIKRRKKTAGKFNAIFFYIFYINCHQTIKKNGETEMETLNIECEQVNEM